MSKSQELRKQILELVQQYYDETFTKNEFQAGDKINYGGRFFDANELTNLVDSSLDFWLTNGRYVKQFEEKLAKFLGVQHCSFVNSGSSANLLAFFALTVPELKDRQVKKGGEVITVATCFPTTVVPIIQAGAVPVFVDIDIPSYNVNIEALKNAISDRTQAIVLSHSLGNPFNVVAVKELCEAHNLWLIEDNCDALGSRYCMSDGWHYTGTFGDIATSSFYPSHHITTGEGGAVYTNNVQLKKIINSLRDWGRDCYCEAGTDNTCQMRFTKKFNNLPLGYDHKYVYSHLGFNLKATECQAAIGCAQLDKIEAIGSARRKNWQYLRDNLGQFSDWMILPEKEEHSDPSWFGFAITMKETSLRNQIVKFLEDHNIQTRMFFAGNILKHPCFEHLTENKDYKVVGELTNSDRVLNNTFWIGTSPILSEKHLAYIVSVFEEFFQKVA